MRRNEDFFLSLERKLLQVVFSLVRFLFVFHCNLISQRFFFLFTT